jgi:16S rRNA (guanine966-N2)-methyltransferase
LRIIAGIHRHREIDAPPGMTTRPMTDRVRESLFNIIQTIVPDAVVLDLFSGSGALGIESLSRGAASCTFVDTGGTAIEIIEANCQRLRLTDQARILRRDVLRAGPWLKPAGAAAYTLIFADPPYAMTASPEGRSQLREMAAKLVSLGVVATGATVMLRAERGVDVELPWEGFTLDDTRSYGTTTLYLMTRT